MRGKKITVLVEKVDFETYKTLKKNNTYPLVVESDDEYMLDDFAYYKDGNLYKLKMQYLKEHCQRKTRQSKFFNSERDKLIFKDGKQFDILKPVEEFDKDGFEVAPWGYGLLPSIPKSSFISLDFLMSYIGIKEDTIEKVTICGEVADLHSYKNMRNNHNLPMIVVLTDEQTIGIPFPSNNDLYIRLSALDYKEKHILILNLTLLNRMVEEGKIELEGIKLKDGQVHKVDKMLGGDYDSLGTISVGDQDIDVMKYTKELLEPKELKTS